MTLKSLLISSALFFAAQPTFAGDPGLHGIHVVLFGQPCILQGPSTLSEQVLKAIHAVSPEQLYPPFESGGKSAPIKTALEKLHSTQGLPDALDVYKELLGKRFEAEMAFCAGLEESLHSKKAEPLLTETKKFIPDGKQKAFETTAKKLDTNLTPAQQKETQLLLFNSFNESMPSDPEEEFHRAIHRLKVQYVCTFEDSSEEGAE